MLKDLLKEKKGFKLICGAGNEDVDEVYELVKIYACAGCRFFDLSANPDIVKIARKALSDCNINDAYICVSVGLKNDPHVSKAQIDFNNCKMCGKCEEICPQKAIKNFKINEKKCIGCKKCSQICKNNAISFYSKEQNLTEILPPVIDLGIDCIEFHTLGSEEKEVYEKWETINKLFPGMLSICISRGQLGDEGVIARLKHFCAERKPYTTIIQADGFPISGGKDDYKTTLQAVAMAEIVQNTELPVYLLLSGGTNSKTAELAHLCGINFSGIAIGSYARKIIKNLDFETAVEIAKNLVNSTL